jgi:hypothetical protein
VAALAGVRCPASLAAARGTLNRARPPELLSAIIHHRGQLSVYLRLNHTPVPSIAGPSTDEQ